MNDADDYVRIPAAKYRALLEQLAEQSTPELWMKWCDSKALDKIDELRSQVDDLGAAYGAEHRAVLAAHAELAALKEAVGKVTCYRCAGAGRLDIVEGQYEIPIGDEPCPDCADLRAILEKQL